MGEHCSGVVLILQFSPLSVIRRQVDSRLPFTVFAAMIDMMAR
jgi:hypothetical protein